MKKADNRPFLLYGNFLLKKPGLGSYQIVKVAEFHIETMKENSILNAVNVKF